MIINSLLDLDLYKLSMMQVVMHKFPGTNVEYEFKCRNDGIAFSSIYDLLVEEVNSLESLKFTLDELSYLKGIRFFKPDFLEFLKFFRLDPKEQVSIKQDPFSITIRGSWINTILFETLILSIVNELYFRQFGDLSDSDYAYDILKSKIRYVQEDSLLGFKFAEFGTRRRFSRQWQEFVIKSLKEHIPEEFHGTSNVFFARKFGLTPIGTMAHEFLQAPQALVRISDSQKYALEIWAQEYRGDLGIALTDVVGIDAFLRDFDLYFCKLFDGVRHDSGDPYEWMRKIIQHYKNHNIDSTTKIAVFSDGLDFEKAIDIHKNFNGQMKMLFAIGTDLTNDCGVDPLNIVIKMTRCNNHPVAKISDSPGKQMCKDEEYLKYLNQVFKIGGE